MGCFFKSFLPFIFFFLLQLVTAIPLMIIQSIAFYTDTDIHRHKPGTLVYLFSLLKDTAFLQRLSIVFAVVVIILFGLWYLRFFIAPGYKKRPKYWGKLTMQFVMSLIFMAFGLQCLINLLTVGIAWVRPEILNHYIQMLSSAGYESVTVLFAVYTVILAPVCEEITFRGLTMGYASKALPFWAANILQSLLFGIIHLNLLQGIHAFFLGLFLGWVCRAGHGIRFSILLHMIFNLLGMLFANAFANVLALSFIGFALTGLALLILAVVIFRSECRSIDIRNRHSSRQRRPRSI